MTIQDIILIAMALITLVVVIFEWRAYQIEKGPVIIEPSIPAPVPPIKVFHRKYKYIVVEHHDERSLNDTAEKYQNEGYVMDREKSTDRLLVFVKSEEVEGKPSGNNRPTYKELNELNNL